jgi:hypothetical protein
VDLSVLLLTVKKVIVFPIPSLVSDIPAGDGKNDNLYLQRGHTALAGQIGKGD